jgi:hypothetical protein
MNKASLNYLLEFSVINSEQRKAYLDKLLSRKNAEGQKNVKLLKIIYRYVDADKINDWNAEEVCKELQIKSGELDTLKSRLISDFRIFVFGWEKIEKELKQNFAGSELEFALAKAKKMNSIGMKREMKTILMNFMNELERNRKAFMKNYNLSASKLFLFEYECVETIGNYYYVQKNYPKFLEFYNRLEALYKLKNKYELTEAEEAMMNVRLFLIRSYKNVFKTINDKNYLSALSNLYAAYDLIKEYQLQDYRYGIPLLIALIEFRLTNNDKLEKICKEIKALAEKEAREREGAVAKSYLAILEFNKDKSKWKEVVEKVKECYRISMKGAPYSGLTFLVIKHYVHLMSFDETRVDEKILKEALANSVLSHNKAFTFQTYYQMENEKHFGKILKFRDSQIPEFIQPDNENLEHFQKVISNISVNMKEGISSNALCNIYITMLYIFYMRNIRDINYIENIKGKLLRMIKTRNIAIDINLYEAVSLAFQMQEDFPIMKKEEFLNKYLFRLKTFCDKLKESEKNSIYSTMVPYSILYTLAQRIDNNEVWELLQKYNWKTSH